MLVSKLSPIHKTYYPSQIQSPTALNVTKASYLRESGSGMMIGMSELKNSETLPVADTAPVAPPVPAPAAQTGLRDFFKRNSLQVAGTLNLLGDAGFFMQGLKDIRAAHTKQQRIAAYAEAIGGGLYSLGGANLVLFGNVDQRKPVNEIIAKTAVFMTEQVGPLPKTTALGALHPSMQKTSTPSFFYRNTAQNTLTAYTLGAGALVVTGISRFRAKVPEGGIMLGYGLASVGVKLASLLIPEKAKEDENEKPATGLMAWLKEKPLRIFGYGSIITDSLLAKRAFDKYKAGVNSTGPIATAGSYILADSMMAISSKDKNNVTGTFSAEDQQHIETLVAQTLAEQPKENQAALLQKVSKFLSKQSGMPRKPHDIAKGIIEHLPNDCKAWASRLENEQPLEMAR